MSSSSSPYQLRSKAVADTDFTPALIEAAQKRIDAAADKKALAEWMREPDNVEDATLGWIVDWMNRRPVAATIRICR